MKVAVVADHHYYADGNGNVYVPSVYGYDYWTRYLSVFDEITVICRGNENVPFDSTKMLLASGENVRFAFVPDFSGIKGMAKQYLPAKRQLARLLSDCDFTFVRVPSPLSRQAVEYLIKHKKLFACEVAADPAENYDTVPFSRIIKRLMAVHCTTACAKANGVAYVTKNALQKKYPSRASLQGESEAAFETYYSNANLQTLFYEKIRPFEEKPQRLELIHIANVIAGRNKGHHVCLEVLSLLKQMQVPAGLTFVGDGPEVPELKKRAAELDVAESICFAGRIANPEDLRDAYLRADILLLPSKTEGLPRCILEAMACGLVCLGSDVGGIPELLESEDLFSWQDAAGFAHRIRQLWNDWQQMTPKGDQNRRIAQQYSADQLKIRRDAFYTKAKQLCEGEKVCG